MNSNVKKYGLWALKTLAALAFLGAGFAKLTSAEMMVATFEGVGIGQWFRYVTGTIEIVGAIALFVPGKAAYGAVALALVMVGAIFSHLVVIGGNPTPAIVLLVLTSTIAWSQKDQIKLIA